MGILLKILPISSNTKSKTHVNIKGLLLGPDSIEDR